MLIPIPGLLLSTRVGIMVKIVFMGSCHVCPLPTQSLIPTGFSVNLAGWFALEAFISPALFQMYPGAKDEWSLSRLMAADTANGGLNQLEDHYKTFIVRKTPCLRVRVPNQVIL